MKKILSLVLAAMMLLTCICASATAVPSPFPIIRGDANSDEKINISDCATILKHLAGWEDIRFDIDGADANLDGYVNLDDVTLLLQFLAGWEGVKPYNYQG